MTIPLIATYAIIALFATFILAAYIGVKPRVGELLGVSLLGVIWPITMVVAIFTACAAAGAAIGFVVRGSVDEPSDDEGGVA